MERHEFNYKNFHISVYWGKFYWWQTDFKPVFEKVPVYEVNEIMTDDQIRMYLDLVG